MHKSSKHRKRTRRTANHCGVVPDGDVDAARALLRLVTPLKSDVPTWWPPKVGAMLRHSTWHSAGGDRVKPVNALLYVLAVFEDKNGEKRIVTAERFPSKRRWNYSIMNVYDAESGRIWPDGLKKPSKVAP